MPDTKQKEGEEARDFVRLLKKHDEKWICLAMEDRHFEGDNTIKSKNCFTYAEIFGTPDLSFLPFGIIMKYLNYRANLVVGVPTGPYHLSMITNTHPTVGLWIEHLPSWYDEPKSDSIHIISKNVADKGLDKRVGSFFKHDNLEFNHIISESKPLFGELVFETAKKII